VSLVINNHGNCKSEYKLSDWSHWGSWVYSKLFHQISHFIDFQFLCVIYYNDISLIDKSFINSNCISGVMVNVLALKSVACEFKPRSVQTKDYEIGNCYFSSNRAALKSRRKDWLVIKIMYSSGATCLPGDCCGVS
jgi:hypothetical protein